MWAAAGRPAPRASASTVARGSTRRSWTWRPFEYFTERLALSGGVHALLTTALEPDGDATKVVTRVRRDAGTRIAWLTASRGLRRRLESRYARLAKLAPVQIPEDRRLPLALG